jgi:ATP-dependent exoDNAse (exonuclease V), alpha subunit - helicase superfamily I member
MPTDLELREIRVTLSPSGPRYVSGDGAFAVWSAVVGEEIDGEAVVLTGPLGHVSAGEQLVCAGAFTEHAKHGLQFAVQSFHSALPQSAGGVRLWLTRSVPGIGPMFAAAIVDQFGAENVFEQLDRDPERLRDVRTRAGRAMSRKSVERAISAWREVATVREVESFLFAHGIGAGLAARLVREYGEDVVSVLTTDPYRLIALPRVGFKIADRIARSLGIELDDPSRLRAGLRFVLEEAGAEGNTFLLLESSGAPPPGCSTSATSTRSNRRFARSSSRRSSCSRTIASIAPSCGRWSAASGRSFANGLAARRPSSSRSRGGRSSRCRTSSGPSSSSSAPDPSCC